MTSRASRWALLAAASGCILGAHGACAQQAAGAGEEAQGKETVLDEIVVTATRRAQSLQEVPAAVAAFTSQAIEAAGIERPADFIGLTSNVNLVETQNAGNAFIIIRGITQARNSEPSVAVIVDGVQQVSAAQFNQELFDIQQIEVLKGPQGGLYGRNAIGGAIVITTRPPSDHLEGKAKFGIDNGFGYTAQASISGPITDTLKFRVSGNYYNTDGFIPNTFLGEDADPVIDLGIRANLLWDATENLSFDLRGSLSHLRTQGLYYNIVADVNDVSLPVRVNNPGQNDRNIYSGSLKVTHESDVGTFSSVTSYDHIDEILTGDAFDFLPIEQSLFFQIFGFDLNQSQFLNVNAWSQEFRFTSPSDRRFRWIVGSYLISTRRFISTGNQIDTGNGVFPVFDTPSTNPLNTQFSYLSDFQRNFAWAVFGNASYKLLDTLDLDFSLRYDRDSRNNRTLTPTAFLPNVPGFPAGVSGEERSRSFDAIQPKVTLTYKPSSAVTLYGGFSRGFRSGGFNQTGVGAVAAGNGIVGVDDIFEAETANTIEVGLKSELFDRRLTFNTSAYTTVSRNSYFFVFLAANSTQNLGNVPRLRLSGFEIDANAKVTRDFELNFGLGYTFSDIKEFDDPSAIGNEAPLISRYTLNVGGQYSHAITGDLDTVLRVDFRRIGKTWYDVQNSTVRDPVNILNARGSLNYGRWSLSAYAENALDKLYNAEFSPGGFVFKARPRRYGAEIAAKF